MTPQGKLYFKVTNLQVKHCQISGLSLSSPKKAHEKSDFDLSNLSDDSEYCFKLSCEKNSALFSRINCQSRHCFTFNDTICTQNARTVQN